MRKMSAFKMKAKGNVEFSFNWTKQEMKQWATIVVQIVTLLSVLMSQA